MKLTGLSRQLAIWMGSIAFAAVLLVVMTSFVFYHFTLTYWPETYSGDWALNWAEAAWLGATMIAGVLLAVFVAAHVAKRILAPLNSVAEGLRAVAKGETSVQATPGDRSLSEAASLADEFNQLVAELNRMKEEREFWNAAIAHELRTPVTILQGRLQGLADGVFEPNHEQFVRLLQHVKGLGMLIEDLRAVSLAEGGHLVLNWQRTDMATLVDDAVEGFAAALKARNQQVHVAIASQFVKCDGARVRQALFALLDNATRYAEQGRITIRVATDGDVCSLSVADAGPGVPAAMREQVFAAFRRVKVGDRAHLNGSGLGLAVVSAIARAHGGRARCVVSEAGGAEFVLEWPNLDHPEGSNVQDESAGTGC